MSSSPYVGKIFTLKQIKRRGIPWCTHATKLGFYAQERLKKAGKLGLYKQGYSSAEELGAHVMVIDERTKQVKIMCSLPHPIWMSRYYLQEEIGEEVGSPGGELGIILTELASLTRKISDFETIKEISGIIKRIRTVKETLEKET